MKTVYFTGHNNFNNRGCEAIVRSTIKLLRQHNKDINFIVPSNNINRDVKQWPDSIKYGVLFVSYKIPYPLKVLWKVQKLLNLSKFDSFNYYPPSLKKIFEKVDIFLSIGGDNYSFDYTYPADIIYLDRLAFKMKKPVILWAASVGKFERMPHLIPKIKHHLSQMKVIYVREKISYKYSKEILGLENVKYSCDPAFALNKQKNEDVDFFLNNLNTKNIVGINLSKLILNSRVRKSNLKNEIKELVKEVNKKYKMHVVFVPHVWDNYKYDLNDDYQLLKSIFMDCSNEDLKVSLAPKKLNAPEVKYLISKFKIFIGARMHSSIAALSSNVPAITISYSIKSEGINEIIFGDKNLVIKSNKLDKIILLKKIDDITKDLKYYKKMLFTKNKSIKKLLDNSSFDLFNQIF